MKSLVVALLLAAPAHAVVDKPQVVADMQNRGILARNEQKWSEEQWTLLWKIKKAEAEGAVDYLIGRVKKIQGLVAMLVSEDGSRKFVLTPAGWERYHFFKSQDAIRAFELRGIELKRIFRMTDMKGRRFFDDAGLLTIVGEKSYDSMQRGEVPRWKFAAR